MDALHTTLMSTSTAIVNKKKSQGSRARKARVRRMHDVASATSATVAPAAATTPEGADEKKKTASQRSRARKAKRQQSLKVCVLSVKLVSS